MSPTVSFDEWRAEQMQDPEVRRAREKLEPAYQITRLRTLRGLTQAELARLAKTRQPVISRLENGKHEPTLELLRRLVEVLGGRLEIRIIALEEAEPARETQEFAPCETEAEVRTYTKDQTWEVPEPRGGRLYSPREWSGSSSGSNLPELKGVSL